MKHEIKVSRIKELDEMFRRHDSFYLLDYQGMTVSQSVAFRKLMRKNEISVKVIKNRLALRALKEEFPEELKPLFRQPTAIAFPSHDPVGLARLLKDFAAQNKVLRVKGGLVEGRFFPPERFDELSKLGSREELLGKVGYLMAYPLMQLLMTWQAPLGNLGRLLSQLKTKK